MVAKCSCSCLIKPHDKSNKLIRLHMYMTIIFMIVRQKLMMINKGVSLINNDTNTIHPQTVHLLLKIRPDHERSYGIHREFGDNVDALVKVV